MRLRAVSSKLMRMPDIEPTIRRVWAMPNADTFSIKPIGALVHKYLDRSVVSVDPFARNKRWATYTNDLNPDTAAEFHLDALEFLKQLITREVKADLAIFDPPYSLRQVKECYASIGIAKLPFDKTHGWRRERDALAALLTPNGYALSFGWNSQGLGKKRGFRIIEILLVSHGREHNDTICTVEQRIDPDAQPLLF